MLNIKYIILALLLCLINGAILGQEQPIFPKNDHVFENEEIQFEWNSSLGAIDYHIQIADDLNFTAITTDVNNINSLSYLSQSLVGNNIYYWRVKADNGNWSAPRSFTIVDYSSWTDLKVWLKADSVEVEPNNYISAWYDYLGNHDFTMPTASRQPLIKDNVKRLNSHSVIEFPSEEKAFFSSSGFAFFSEGDIFSLLKIDKAVPINSLYSGLWSFGKSFQEDYYPFTDGLIYSDWGRTESFAINNNTVNLDSFHILNISTGTDFDLRINNSSLFNSSNGSALFKNGVSIGKSRGNSYFNGLMAEVLIFDIVLNDSLRELTHEYLRYKFAPPVNLGRNISYSLCDSVLFAGAHFDSYLWSDGSIADSLIVNTSGTYWVEVEDIFGLISRDTIEVLTKKFEYPNQQNFCSGDSIIWQTNLGSNYTYSWKDGSTADTLIIDSPGNVHVSVTDIYGCVFESDTLSFIIDEFALNATLGADTNLCSGNNIGLTIGANDAVNYIWSTGENTPEIVINTTGTYSVITESSIGCVLKDTINVTILGDAPTINTQLPTTICVNETFNFQDLSTTTDGSTIIGWDWDLGDGTTSLLNQGNHSYSTGGIYTIDLTIETSVGCFNNQTATIEVKENPILTYAASNQCQDESIQFNGGQMSPQTITNWEWNFDDPTSGIDNIANGQNVAHTYTAYGDYDVMLIGTDIFGCVDTLIQTKTIEPTPVADFTFIEVCAGNIVSYQNTSTVATPSVISNNQWSFGDGTNSNQANPQKPYSSHGIYTVELITTANNGCSNSISKDIKIHAIPQVESTIDQDCAGLETSFTDASFVPDGSVAQVEWIFNNQNPLNGFNVTKNFANSGIYTLEQKVSSGFGCENSKISSVTINSYLNADFIFTPSAFIAEYPIAFESTSSGENEYLWSFGNFATTQQADTSVVFEESQIGTEQTVELRVKNEWDCLDSISVKLPVMDQRTDLEISQLFSQDINGFLTIGVRLKNIGSTPISEVDLVLNSPSTGFIKETWSGMLQADEEEIYIFSANPSAKISAEDTLQNFLCIEGIIIQPAQFMEEEISNNEVCKTMTDNQTVIVFPYPNPVKDELTIKVVMPKKGVIALSVYDDRGKLIYMITEKQELEKGLNEFVIETSTWSSGRYSIVFEGEGQVPTVGFVKI
ncbi:PKD domain-containing protein [Brumimicrobium glaciale]|nr:PKD domain-containing protein [Brumimicrobium glaciale]